ncbi:MAG: 1-acyl-sn-glycerol-3-phosphate acyltransferase [Bacteroidia bacterium]|nr:1-acyl-sn-glycerol-3-phosphate acyltransferase [Bacteroidia bacterium]
MLLKYLYELARILVLYVQRIYYRNPTVINEDFLKIDSPTIVVSNHPNTLLDAVFAAAAVDRQVNFLANYSLFKSKFGNWFFSTFYCIPIERPEDVKHRPVDNQASLHRSHEFLRNGGNLYIAAEGYSIQTIGIRDLKTGAARIALNTEYENDWNVEIQILPIGLNYDQAEGFRSNLVIYAGKPFKVRNWRKEFESAPRKAARDVTDYLEDQLKSLTFEGDQKRLDLLKKIRSFYNYFTPTDPKREYLRSRGFMTTLNQINEVEIKALEDAFESFGRICRQSNLTPQTVWQANNPNLKRINISILIWSLPITIYGFLVNIIPYFLCHWIDKIFNKHLVYKSTVRILAGLIFFPLMYLFWMKCIYIWSDSWLLTLASLFTFRRSGIFSWRQIKSWKQVSGKRKYLKRAANNSDIVNAFVSLQTTLNNHQL